MPPTLIIPSLVLAGRAEEQERLYQLLDAVRAGNGHFALLLGEAGVGKSRLCRDLRASATHMGMDWAEGRALPTARDQGYGLITSACRAVLRILSPETQRVLVTPIAADLIKLLPDVRWILSDCQPSPALEPAAERSCLAACVIQLLTSYVRHKPLVLVLEDIHWADSLSVELLTVLAYTVSQLPLLMIATCRNSEVLSNPLLHALDTWERERLITRIDLLPLNSADLDMLIRAVLPLMWEIAPAFVTGLHQRTAGNPFFAEELLRALSAADQLMEAVTHGPGAAWEQIFLTQTLTRTILDRVAQLTPQAGELLRIAAVFGPSITFNMLHQVSGLDETALVEALRMLVTELLLHPSRDSADSYTFRHALTREAVLSALLPHERQSFHARIAATLEQQPAPSATLITATLADHWLQSAEPERALPRLLQAAEEAAGRHAYAEARRHYARAATLQTQDVVERGRLWALAGDMAARSGETTHEVAHYQAALDIGVTSVRWKLASALLTAGDLVAATAHIREAEVILDLTSDGRERGHTLLVSVRVDLSHGTRSIDELASLAREARALFVATGDHDGIYEAEQQLATLAGSRGDWNACRTHEEGMLAASEASGRFHRVAEACLWLTTWWMPLDRAIMEMWLERARQTVAAHGSIRNMVTLSQVDGHLHWLHGRYPDALAAVTAGEVLARRHGLRAALAYLHCLIGHCHRRLGDWDASEVAYLHGLELAPFAQAGQAADQRLHHGLGRLRLSQGRYTEAETHLRYATGDALADGRRPTFWSLPALTELYVRMGDPARAEEIAERMERFYASLLPGEPHARSTAALAAFTTGLIHSAQGHWNAAETALHASLVGWRAQGWPHEIGRTLTELAVVWARRRRSGDRQRATEALREALDIFITIGAQPDVITVQSLAARELLILNNRTAELVTTSPLSPREREIAARIAQGQTNRQIAQALVLSEKTIETHVSRIFAKLNVGSRSQIAVWSRDHGLL